MRYCIWSILAVALVLAALALPLAILAEEPPPVVDPPPAAEPPVSQPAPTCSCPRTGFGYAKPEDSFLCRLWVEEPNMFYWSDMDRGWWIRNKDGAALATNPRLDDMRTKNYYRRDIANCPQELWR